ncbi:hypothetical protein, conserved [Trypanosoma brucei gambiense DAL972]|uniref:Histone RNA hairpin-binding protein RNA-binding domain-containing protein n=2 Tax=Trypanosoma brucei TaxID=5691 RepID=C9ZK79_TRYB9|nr:hypothetical protein, conserved [Trypanosoma brucei gambiense DAL972]RHW73553.1 Histone RNA hairpin-binding protein RNA-binding domain containing protein [Trypanosoma brucei equiperdum]CBH09843.1 hypothetical protein, conserved [Trypanosoma brucei gambiense DAL972]|eukprot:XP_011772136.1 hypothetical protein, conserved [Trypanosoma brucei gambiense DAL972]
MSMTESSTRRALGSSGVWMNNSYSGANHPKFDTSLGTGSPKIDISTSQTPIRNGASSTTSVAATMSQQLRSPMVTVHQPYRSIPPSVFGVESELERYTRNPAETAVPVTSVYKSVVSRTPDSMARCGYIPSQCSSQRSPIAVLDGGDIGHAGDMCGGDVTHSATPHDTAVAGGGTTNGSSHIVSTRVLNNNGNKRMVTIVHLGNDADCAGPGGYNASEPLQCPIALRMVEAEEKHLNYSGVELDPADLNRGDTTERARRLQQRLRQVQYGKETAGYENYIRAVPSRCDREFRNPMHPMTPRPEYDCSKRTFDRYLNVWRRQLHLWDDYDADNLAPQYTRIGIPTLGRLGLERVQNAADEQSCGFLSFTPTTAHGVVGTMAGTVACTPVVTRNQRRDVSVSMPSASHQRPGPYAVGGLSAVGGPHGPSMGMPNVCSSNVCGGGGGTCSIPNTPHTPYYGSTHSNSSHMPPFLSVLAQPTIYSPHWADSSRQGSPIQHGAQRSVGYSYNSTSGCSAPGNGCGTYMDNTNHCWNNVYAGGYHSPYGGHRATPHSSPNHHHYSYYNGAGVTNLAPPSPMCVGHEGWGNSLRQQRQ